MGWRHGGCCRRFAAAYRWARNGERGMNREDRRRQAKLQRTGKKAPTAVDQAIVDMIDPIVVLLNAQELDKAESALRELLSASPNYPEGLHLLGLLLSQTDRQTEGIG